MIDTAIVGLLMGIIIVAVLGILAARFSHSKSVTKPNSIGFSQRATSPALTNLNKDDPEGMKLAGGGNTKNQFPVPNSGR
jgi:hypothetical protein